MRLIQGDALEVLKTLPGQSAQMCVTSPPYYGLRDYGYPGQIGLEETPNAYVDDLVAIFREVRRVLKDDGTVWLNLGDCYAGSGKGIGSDHGKSVVTDKEIGKRMKLPDNIKPKDLIGIPWMTAFALRSDGWWLRRDIIWHKPNGMPENVDDRPTGVHEYVFLLSKSARYYYDAKAIAEPLAEATISDGRFEREGEEETEYGKNIPKARGLGRGPRTNGTGTRNKRSVWTINTKPYPEAHFATYPPDLVEPCVLAGSKPGDTVLDPFNGSGTTGVVALGLGRDYIGIELNAEYIGLTEKRLQAVNLPLMP